jgi:nitroreductase
MNTLDALRQRKSVRAYLDKPVETENIDAILDAARHAPSGANIQPWQVAVVTGKTLQSLQEKIENAFRSGIKSNADYQYYPLDWLEPYKTRRVECGMMLYQALHIERHDKQRRLEQWAANYRSFGAPVALFYFMDNHMQAGSYMDCGMFIQSVMLAAVDLGLATCPQAALAEYPDIVRSELGYPDNKILLCGMALGFEDSTAAVNSYRTSREMPEAFTDYFD